NHVIAKLAQHDRCDVQDILIILDHEHASRTRGDVFDLDVLQLDVVRLEIRCQGGFGQVEIDRGPRADRALDGNMSAGLPHESVDHAKPEPGPPADLLGGEERLEYAIQGFRCHAVTRVRHGEPDIWSGSNAGDRTLAQGHVSQLDL